ncbi:MAG TPA: N-acetylmuramoyl-L-alanine amidase [Roseiflexaceae bacterium]|nr:N-acetylmuramoyl-L-alanine amidase [Roseiflexaceae bacterium]
MEIRQVGITGNSFTPGGPNRKVRMVVMHSTAARGPGDFNYLRRGGAPDRPVSIHYYIAKDGTISQMVPDHDIAWQAGKSSWKVDGQVVAPSCNPISVGIELENLNTGRDPYPEAQYQAALWLTRHLVTKYNIPRSQVVRHLDISPGRKTDPRGFPWERFMAELFAPNSAPPSPAPASLPPAPQPPPQPLPASQQLRKFLVDLAYRAAGASHPAGWPLLKQAVSKATGMPIWSITPQPSGDGAGEDEDQRAVLVAGVPTIVEAYARDLFFALADTPDQVQQLSAAGRGPHRDELLRLLFQAADPQKGFRPTTAFHQLYLERPTEIGVPLGPDTVLQVGGKTYSLQHFAVDTLIWNGSRVVRLSDLTRDMYGPDAHTPEEKALRNAVLNDLYQTFTGRAFDRTALFCRYAIQHGLGAPRGKAEAYVLEGNRLVAMPYALDVLYCRIPNDGNWKDVVVGAIPGLLADGDAGMARLSKLLQEGDVDEPPPVLAGGGVETAEDILPGIVYEGGLLGDELRGAEE